MRTSLIAGLPLIAVIALVLAYIELRTLSSSYGDYLCKPSAVISEAWELEYITHYCKRSAENGN